MLGKEEMDKLIKLRGNDVSYHVTARVDSLCAKQDRAQMKLLKLTPYVKTVIVDTTETEISSGKTDESVRSVREKVRKIKGSNEIKVYCFEVKDEILFGDIGGDRGVIRTGLYRAVQAMNKARFMAPPIDLIRVLPDSPISLGKYPPERSVENPITILEPRSRGTTAEVVGYEAIMGRTIEFNMKLNSGCPLSEDETYLLIHALEDVPLGPTKRGHITILDINRAKGLN